MNKNAIPVYRGEYGPEFLDPSSYGGTATVMNFSGTAWPMTYNLAVSYIANPKRQKCEYCQSTQTEHRATCSQCGAPL